MSVLNQTRTYVQYWKKGMNKMFLDISGHTIYHRYYYDKIRRSIYDYLNTAKVIKQVKSHNYHVSLARINDDGTFINYFMNNNTDVPLNDNIDNILKIMNHDDNLYLSQLKAYAES